MKANILLVHERIIVLDAWQEDFRAIWNCFIGLVILLGVVLLSGATIGFASFIDGSARSFGEPHYFDSHLADIFAGRLLFKLFSMSYLVKTIKNDDCVTNSQNGHSMLALAGLCLLVLVLVLPIMP